MIQCSTCDAQFRSRKAFKQHLLQAHHQYVAYGSDVPLALDPDEADRRLATCFYITEATMREVSRICVQHMRPALRHADRNHPTRVRLEGEVSRMLKTSWTGPTYQRSLTSDTFQACFVLLRSTLQTTRTTEQPGWRHLNLTSYDPASYFGASRSRGFYNLSTLRNINIFFTHI